MNWNLPVADWERLSFFLRLFGLGLDVSFGFGAESLGIGA